MKKTSIALAVLGVALTTVLVAWFDAGRVLNAVLSVGWHGLGLLLVWQIVLSLVLGGAWSRLVPREARQPGLFVWGRMVRDAAGTCLPFSHMGGFVLGARAVTLHGVRWETAAATTIADVTAEFVAGWVFSALGVIVLLAQHPESPFTLPLLIALAAALGGGVLLVVLQRGAGSLLAPLGRRIAGAWLGDARQRMAALQTEMTRVYSRPGDLLAAATLHLLAWFATGVGTWLALHLLGANITLADAIAIEALLRILLTMAFLVPGYAGVQEAAYVGLGAVFGLSPDIALGVSLLRRARDLVFGVPVLLIWQAVEVRRLRTRSLEPRAPG